MQKFRGDITEPDGKANEGFPTESDGRADQRLSVSYGGKTEEYTETVMFEGPNSISDYDLVIPVSQVSGTIKLADFEDIPEVSFDEGEVEDYLPAAKADQGAAGGPVPVPKTVPDGRADGKAPAPVPEKQPDFYRENSISTEPEEDVLNTDPAAVNLEPEVHFPEEKKREAQDKPRQTGKAQAPEGRKTAVPETKPRKKKKSAAGPLAAGLILLLSAGLGAGYYHYYRYFQTHFYAGSTINGVDVSYQTAETAKAHFNEELQSYSLTIEERDGTEETITAAQLGWSYSDDGTIDRLISGQDAGKWLMAMRGTHDYELNVGSTYDSAKALSAISRLKCLSAAETELPEDARIEKTEEGLYEIIPEVEGNEVDRTKLEEAVKLALSEGRGTVSLTDPDCYRHPEVYADDAELVGRRDDWNRFMGVNLTYLFGGNKEVIDADVISTCLTDDGSKVTLSTDWITPLVSSWAKRYNTLGRTMKYTTHSGKTVSVESVDYGWSVDVEATAEAVEADVLAGGSGEREAVFSSRGMGWENGGLTNTYIEVSLAAQKLWMYVDGVQTVECDIVSGSRGTKASPTEKGIYAIDAKETSENAGDSESNWVLPFNGDQGLRDAPWRTEFGKRIYRTDGSDGSIEIPSEAMRKIFAAAEPGMAVVIY